MLVQKSSFQIAQQQYYVLGDREEAQECYV